MDVAGPRRPLGSRLLWAAVAQGSSSATNFALYLGILASTDTERLGRWVAVIGVYSLALALSRSLVSEPMVAGARCGATGCRFSWPWARRRYAGIGAIAALGVVVIGSVVGADGPTVLAVAAAQPILIGQDGLRNLAWSRNRPELAVAVDFGWLLVTGGALGTLLLADAAGASAVVWSWLAGGLVSAAIGRRLIAREPGPAAAGPPPESGEPTPFVPSSPPELAGRLDGRRRSHALLISARNLLPITVAIVIGPGAAGLLKAGLLPFTPILTLFAGLRLVALPALQRAAEADAESGHLNRDRSAVDRVVVRMVGGYAVVAVGLVLATMAAVTALSGRLDAVPPIGRGALGWGGAVVVMTVVVRPLAEAAALGRGSGSALGHRAVEMAVEWGAVFGVAIVAGPDRVLVGWAVGMAIGGLVWVRAGFTGGPVRALPDPVAIGAGIGRDRPVDGADRGGVRGGEGPCGGRPIS